MKRLLAILVVAVCLSITARAMAAPLNYTNNTQVVLTSPSTTFTISAGSVADSLVVNATDVVVGLSASTGGTFTLTSPSYDLTVTPSGGGGTDPTMCTSGTASVTITQSSGSATYTITPTASQCTSGGGGGGGGGSSGGGTVGVSSQYGSPNYGGGSGGGGGSYTPIPPASTSTTTVSTSTTSITSTSSLQAELVSLQAELAALLAQAGQTQATSSPVTFARNLSIGMTGSDVTDLQEFLIAQASGPAAAKLKAHGTTQTFGILTFNALKEFQTKAGIVPASGYFGPKTRAYVNAEE